MSISINSTKFCSFDLFWDFDVVYTILIKICKTFHYYFVKLDFCQFDMIKILRVFSSNIILETKILIVLLIVVLKIFFEINNDVTNKLIINELLKTRDKRTWKRFEIILFDNKLSSKKNNTINRETKFWYVCDCWYFCVISKNRS